MKKGITLIVLVFTLILLSIVLGSAVILGLDNITTAQYRQFVDLFEMVNNNINAYILENDELPTNGEVVSLNSMDIAFRNSVILNSDETNKLYIVNMQKLKNTLLKLGYGSLNNGDIFVVAENSNNVYYVKGAIHKGKYIYSLNDILLSDR